MRPSSDSKKRPASDNAAHQNPNALPPKRQRRKSTSETSKDVSLAALRRKEMDELSSYQPADRIIQFEIPEDGKPVWSNVEDRFPRFKGGSVFIELVEGSRKYSYSFDAIVLAKFSPWFIKEMLRPVVERDNKKARRFKLKSGYNHRFELSFNGDNNTWVLKNVPFTTDIKLDQTEQPKTTGQPFCSQNSQTSKEPSAIASPTQAQSFASPMTDSRASPKLVLRSYKAINSKITSMSALSTIPVLEQLPINNLTVGDKENDLAEKGNKNTKGKSGSVAKETDEQSLTGILSTPKDRGSEVLILEDNKPPLVVCESYNNLFLLMNGFGAKLDYDNVDAARNQIEDIIKLATYYGCLKLICRPSLGKHLVNFGYSLYKAIMLDAPRYLKLSIYLESVVIFKEAMVHAVGQFLDYPWKTYPAPEFPDHIFQLLALKNEEIHSLKVSADVELFTSSVDITGCSLTLVDSSLQRWIVIHQWRDWISLAVKQNNESYPGTCTYGVIYRLIEKGGDAYLPAASVYHYIKGLEQIGVRGWDMKGVEKDLNMMKDFGKGVVGKLCVNNSKLDIEEAGIKYLTCCEIEDDELPWMENGVLKATDEKWPVRGLRPPTQ